MVTKAILIQLDEKVWEKFKAQTKESGILLKVAVAKIFRDAVKRDAGKS